MQKNQFYGVVSGSIPKVSSGGAPSTTDVYRVKVTKAGPSGTAEITVTNTAGTDNLAANTIATGVAEALGTKSGTFTAVFEYLHLGDFWTIQQYATGEIEEPIAGTGNYRGTVIPISVNESGNTLVALTTTENTWAQLTAVGYSAAFDVTGNMYHTVVLTIGGSDDCDPIVQWSLDGTNWYNQYAGDDISPSVVETHWDALVKYVRVGMTAEHGTSSTLDAVYYGGR